MYIALSQGDRGDFCKETDPHTSSVYCSFPHSFMIWPVERLQCDLENWLAGELDTDAEPSPIDVED